MPLRDDLEATFRQLRPLVDAHVTTERVRRYMRAISGIPAPSTAAAALRAPELRRLLAADEALGSPGLHLHEDFAGTGSTVILTGSAAPEKAVWAMAHLDTLSYLVQPRQGERYPLVPFGYHLMAGGSRPALAWRYDHRHQPLRRRRHRRDRERGGRAVLSARRRRGQARRRRPGGLCHPL